MVGRKVAIVSDKPQTTRRAIRGVSTGEDAQLVLVDLPGVQRPRDALTSRMQARVEREVAEDDAVLFVLNGQEGIGPGRPLDRRACSARLEVPVVIAVNKIDRPARGAPRRDAARRPPTSASATTSSRSPRAPGKGVGPLLEHLRALLPEGPFFYPPESPSRPARRGHARRAHPRADPAPDLPGGPARGRGRRRGASRTARTTRSSAPAPGPRPTRRRASSSARAAR